jgi:histidinol-phosphate aminotransferase
LHDGTYSLNYSPQQLDKASLVWICNPNNPTGTRIPREKIIDILQRAEGMVVVDECNYEYLGETVVDLIDKYENLIISRSFSKNYGLAGLRLGFAISSPQNIKKLTAFGQHFRVNRMAEKAAAKVLKYLDYYQEVWGKMKKVRDKFVWQINELGFSAYDSKANFVLVEFKDKKKTERVWKYLKENGIYTLAGWENEFSGLDDNFIRFTIGVEWEMDRVVEVLSDYVKKS